MISREKYIGVLLVVALSLSNGYGIRLPSPPSDPEETNFKLRLPNELEMGLSQSPQHDERTEDSSNNDRKNYQHRNIHMDMNTHQLQFHFGVSTPQEVKKETYQIVKIVPIVVPSSMWNNRHNGSGSQKQKRDGSETSEDATTHFKMDVFNRKIRYPMRQNDKLLKGNFDVVHVDDKGNRKKRMTKRMAHNLGQMHLNHAMKLTKEARFNQQGSGRMSVVEKDPEIINPTELHQNEFEPEFEEICSQYQHVSRKKLGVLSQCDGDGIRGSLTNFEDGETFEIHPLGPEFSHVFENYECYHCRNQNGTNEGNATTRIHHGYHVVVRRSLGEAQKLFEEDNHGKKRNAISDIIQRSSSLKGISMFIYFLLYYIIIIQGISKVM